MIIDINTSTPYKVIIQDKILSCIGNEIKKISDKIEKVFIISDTNVYPIYGDIVKSSILQSDLECFAYCFDAGEKSKNQNTYFDIVSFLAKNNAHRNDIIVSLGGGVVGDLSGFVAGTYMRGINYIQVPTSLLAMIDSSVGGKCGIDLLYGKNLLGVFYQPLGVYIDTNVLDTLPSANITDGIGEGIKYAILKGGELINILSEMPNKDNIKDFISHCIMTKNDYVFGDECDKNGKRAFLNLGHTIGHAIEKLSNYTISHGEGVALGIGVIAKASFDNKMLSESDYRIIVELLNKYNLDKKIEFLSDKILEATKNDKKSDANGVTEIVIEAIGKCSLKYFTFNQYSEFINGYFG